MLLGSNTWHWGRFRNRGWCLEPAAKKLFRTSTVLGEIYRGSNNVWTAVVIKNLSPDLEFTATFTRRCDAKRWVGEQLRLDSLLLDYDD